ncbi:hypothetical protein Tco_1546017 [Tanacetum coccineum]
MSENKDKYHDTVLDLEARAKKNEDVVLKTGNSFQGMFMLGPKPLSFYDSKVKHGLGYTNPYILKKAISQNPKLYDASCLDDLKIQMNVRDTEDIFNDATKSQIKMKKKSQDPIAIGKKQNVWTIDYKKLNALYEDFVPQKEFSAEQKYFSSSFISSKNSSNASSPYSSFETKPTMTPIPSANPILVDLNKMENVFTTLFELLQMNSKRENFHAQNQDLLITISELKAKLKNDEKRKPNVEYFHMFGSLGYPINDRDDLGKMKPKAEIGIFMCYSKTSREFRIYNRRTKKLIETIHVKFDELTTMASEHDSLEPSFQRFINDESSAESMNIPSKEDLDNLFGPMYEEYFEKRSSDTSINSAAQQVHNQKDSPSTSSIIIEEHEV